MKYNIAVIKGDGIGPEVTEQAMLVLDEVGKIYGHDFCFTEVLAGGAAIDALGICLPNETVDICKKSDSVMLGALGGPAYDSQPPSNRPEKALLSLREQLELYANLRPAKIYPSLSDACPLKDEIVQGGLDIMIVRELTGDVYFGKKELSVEDGFETAHDDMRYSVPEVERIAKRAFELAKVRKCRVTSVDKANVLETSRLWRRTVIDIAKSYPDVELSHMYVDNAAMQLVRNPKQFDVILTGNLFGDILSDEASMITGSIGLLPSASMGDGTFGMYEPIHGSAPDIAGQNKANPIAAILSASMMLKYSFGLIRESEAVEQAVEQTLKMGARTADIAKNDEKIMSCTEAGEIIRSFIKK